MKVYNNTSFFEKVGLRDFTLLSLKKSEEIIRSIKSNFLNSKKESEFLINSLSFIDSDLLRKMYLKVFKNSQSYIYTGDHDMYGVLLANAKDCITKSLSIAKESVRKSCHIISRDFTYYFKIRYNDPAHTEHPDSFNIEMIQNEGGLILSGTSLT